jgi:hypothetical protein
MDLPELSEIQSKVRCSISELIEHDYYLLSHDVNERSISHRLAVYLGSKFVDWDVDCEYNKQYNRIKKVNLKNLKPNKMMSDDTDGTTVYPDIIIHKRGACNSNLLVIEIKKSKNKKSSRNTQLDNFDLEKLKAYKKDLIYKHALFLKFFTNKEIDLFYDEKWDDDIDSS